MGKNGLYQNKGLGSTLALVLVNPVAQCFTLTQKHLSKAVKFSS
jgi:hypothetical protein